MAEPHEATIKARRCAGSDRRCGRALAALIIGWIRHPRTFSGAFFYFQVVRGSIVPSARDEWPPVHRRCGRICEDYSQ